MLFTHFFIIVFNHCFLRLHGALVDDLYQALSAHYVETGIDEGAAPIELCSFFLNIFKENGTINVLLSIWNYVVMLNNLLLRSEMIEGGHV